jgi:hypothetical protein
MLFDLRSRGRRRTVQGIYLMLAVLMGGGLVFWGIGSGGVGGGLFDAIGLGGGSKGRSAGNPLEKIEQQAERQVRTHPADPKGWAALAKARYQLAGQGENYDQNTGKFTATGRRELARAAQAWNRHLAVADGHPDADVARLMVQAYGPFGLNQPREGVRAAEIVAEAQPTAQTYYQLAVYAYAAGQTRKGDLAARKAVQLAPPDQRAAVKAQVDAAKQQGGFAQQPGS